MKRMVTWVVAVLVAMPAMLSASTAPSALPIEATQEVVKQKKAVVKEAPTPATKQARAAASKYTLTVLSPQGSVKKGRDLAPRLGTLEGKKVAMWLSSTRDQLYAGKGAELYDLLAKMLKEKFANIKIVPYTDLPMKFAPDKEVIAAITAIQPDAVVAGFGG